MNRSISLRFRLTVAFAVGMTVVLAALGGFVYFRMGASLLQSVDLDLRSRAGLTLGVLRPEGPLPVGTGHRLIDPDEAFAQVLDPAGRIVDTTPSVARAPMIGAATVRSISRPTFLTRQVVGIDDPARLLAVPVEVGTTPLLLVVGAPLGDRQEALSNLVLLFAIGGPVALALSSLAGWVLAGAALRPVERMRREADAISESEPSGRLAVPMSGDELTRLALTLNALLDRLQEALDREHRFVDDASHELRTPLATLKAELDLAAARPRSVDELEATVHSALGQTDRLVRLAEDLLVLARTSRGRLPVRREETPVRALLEEAAAPFREPVGQSGGTLRVDAPDEPVMVDPARIRQAVHNMLDNALRHGHPASIVVVGAKTDGALRIRVEDDGPGFPSQLLGSAFEPFVRGSSATSDPGAGLGLSIVKAVAEAHGGRAKVENLDGGGARVELTVRG